MRPALRTWFYRVAATQFLLTAATGMLLYFRPLDERQGAYSKTVKEWLVMLHNGEWISEALFGSRYASGLLIGGVLSALVVRFAWRVLKSRARDAPRP